MGCVCLSYEIKTCYYYYYYYYYSNYYYCYYVFRIHMNSNVTTMVQVTKFDVVNWLLWMIKTNINKQAIFLQTAGKRYQHRDFIKHTSCEWSDEELSLARRGVTRSTTFQISFLPPLSPKSITPWLKVRLRYSV